MHNTNDGPEAGGQEVVVELGSEASKIAYLLQELDKWLGEGVLTSDAHEALSQRYKAEQTQIVRSARVNRLLSEARTARLQRQAADALGKLTEALEIDPDNLDCQALMAGVYEDAGRLAEALSVYELLGVRSPGDAAVQDGLNRVLQALDTQRLSQEQIAALGSIAELGRAGDKHAAIGQCQAFVSEHPDSVDAHALLASLCHEVERCEDSVVQMRLAVALSPESPQLKNQLLAYERALAQARERERQEKQRDEAEVIGRARAARAQELAAQARQLLAQGRSAEALAAATESLDHDPESADAWALAAQAYSAGQMWEQAEHAWAEAVGRDPGNAGYRAELGKAAAVRSYQERSVWSKLWDKGSQAVEAFMEERNVQWVHMLGAAILLAGLIGVSAWVVTVQKLWGIVGRALVAILPLLVTAAFYYLGYRLRAVLKTTATTFHGIASVVLPLDLVMMKHLFPDLFAWDWDHHLVAVSLVSTLVYILVLTAARSRVLMSFAAAGFLVTSFYFMRSFTSLSPSSQGLWFSIVGFAYMVTARWIRRRGWSPLDTPLDLLAHAGMAVALGSSLISVPGSQNSGLAASYTVLAVSLAYVLAAYVLDEARYLPIFAVVLFGFTAIALQSHGLGVDQWYLYGLCFGVVGCAFLVMAPVSRLQDRDSFAGWYQWFGLAVTAIAVLPTLGRGLFEAATVQMLPSGPELGPSILTCLVISVFYTACSVWMDKPRLVYGSAVVFTYSALLAIRLADRPSCEYTVWMTLLAAIMAASGYYLRQRHEQQARAIRRTGTALAAVSGVVSLGMWVQHSHALRPIDLGYRDAALLAMLVSSAFYAFAARVTRRAGFVVAAITAGVLAWGAGFSWLDDYALALLLGREVNYGLYYLPLVGLLIWMRYAFLRKGNPEFAVPCDVASLLVSIGVLFVQAHYLAESGPMRDSLWATLVLYSALFAWQSWERREESLFGTRVSAASTFAYLAISTFWAAAFYVMDTLGLCRPLTALTSILIGGVGASLLASRLANAGRPQWNRALLVTGCGVFVFGLLYAYVWVASPALFLAIGVVAAYAALVYSARDEEFATRSALGFGIGYLAACAVIYTTLPAAPAYGPYLCIAAALANGIAFAWLAGRIKTRVPAYIATLGIVEAALIALFRCLEGATTVGLHRLGFVGISAALLIAAWVLLSRRQRLFAEAPFVVGNVMLALVVWASVSTWLNDTGRPDRLIALLVTAVAALLYGAMSVVLRNRWYLWPSMVTLSVAYGLAGAHWLMPHLPEAHANYGVWFVPLIAAMAIGGDILHRKQQSGFAAVLHLSAAALVAISLCLQPEYSTLSEFIAFFAYGLLFVWVSIRARNWAYEIPANMLTEGSVHFGTALLGVGWLLMFDWIGTSHSHLALCRTIAALTGVAWSLAWFRASVWMSGRDWEWWARPMFWSAVAGGVLWTLWPVVCEQSAFPWSLATCALVAVLYTWIAAAHADRAFAYCGIGAFAVGYLGVFLSHGELHAAPARLVWFSLAPVVLAVCTGYLSVLFRSRTFAYVTTLAAEWTCFLWLSAGLKAAGVVDPQHYAFGLAAIGFVALWVSHALTRSRFEELAIAPAHGSDFITTMAAAIVLSLYMGGCEDHWPVSAAAMAFCTATYALSACLRKRPGFLYAASATAVAGWGLVNWRFLIDLVGGNYALFYVPLVAVLGWLAYVVRGRSEVDYHKPLWRSAMALSIGCAAGELAHLDHAPSDIRDVITIMSLSVLYALGAYLDREMRRRAEALTYLSCGAFLAAVSIIPWPPHLMRVIEPAMPLVYAVLGAAWTGMAFYLESRSWTAWTRGLLVSAGAVEVLAVLPAVMVWTEPMVAAWNVAAIVVAAAVFAWMAQKTQRSYLVHLAGGAALVGGLGLWHRFQPGTWIVLLPLLIPALGAGALAQATRVREYAVWFPALLWTAFLGFAVWSPSPLLSPAPTWCVAFIVAMGLSAALFQRLARQSDQPAFEVLAGLSGLVAYWYVPALVHGATTLSFDPVAHAAITLLPYAALLAWLCWRLRDADGKPLYKTYGAVALALSAAGVAASLGSAETATVRTVTLALYTLGYSMAAARFGWPGLVYLSNASGLLTWYTLYVALEMPEALPCGGAWFGILGVLQVCLGVAFDRRAKASQTGKIICTIGTAVCTAAALVALCGALDTRLYGEWAVAALLMSTVANSTMAVARREIGLVHAGFLGLLISLYLVFYDKLDLRVLHVYALPIGIYLIALPAISRQVGRQIRPGPYYSAGLAIMLGSGLVTLVQKGWQDWNSYVLLTESVVAVLYGLSRHVKVFLFFGTAFSAVWVAALVRDSVVRQMHGGTLVAGITGIVIGTSLIVFASRSEQRRTEILDSIRQAARSFREWE